MSRLPHEVYDMMMNYLDQNDLCSCGAVCKAWVPLSRSRLFDYVALNADTLRNKHFWDLFRSPLVTIAAHMRTLCCDGDIDDCLPYTGQLKSLRSFRANGHSQATVPAARDVFWRFLKLPKSLTELFLERFDISTPEDLVKVISALPLLERLQLLQFRSTRNPPFSGSVARLPQGTVPCLRDLDVDACLLHLFEKWASDAEHVLIESLVVTNPTASEPVSPFLHILGPGLKHFGLTINDPCIPDLVIYGQTDLSHNTHLRSLHITDQFLLISSDTHPPFPRDLLLPFLHTLSPSLEELAFFLRFDRPADLARLPLHEMDELFAGPRHSCLAGVAFDLWSTTAQHEQEAREVIENAMPLLKKKGFLEFDVHWSPTLEPHEA